MKILNTNPEVVEKLDNLADFLTEKVWDICLATTMITQKHYEDHEGKWPIGEQYFKCVEESVEAHKAFMRNLEDKNEEHFDILFSWITLTHMRNLKKEEVREAILNDLVKFHNRGWLY